MLAILPPMRDPKELERKRLVKMLEQEQKDAAYLRRLRCRELIFGKGRGQSKNLNYLERKFCISVAKESYQLYLAEFAGATPRYKVGDAWQRKLRRRRRTTGPLNFMQWRKCWWGSQKVRWNRHDLPRMMDERFKRLQEEKAE